MPEGPEALRGDPGDARTRQQGLQSRVHADAVHQRQGAEWRRLDRRNGQADPALSEELIEAFPLLYFGDSGRFALGGNPWRIPHGTTSFRRLIAVAAGAAPIHSPGQQGTRPIRRAAEWDRGTRVAR